MIIPKEKRAARVYEMRRKNQQEWAFGDEAYSVIADLLDTVEWLDRELAGMTLAEKARAAQVKSLEKSIGELMGQGG